MSPRIRVVGATAVAAVLAAAAAVGVATRYADGSGQGATAPSLRPQAGAPPLSLRLGTRSDPEAADLRRAAQLYERGRRARARAIFERYTSLEARVGRALAAWPEGTVARLGQLAALNPGSALVQLHLGLARFWAGQPGAEAAWREAASAEPDTPYAITAGDLLHPDFAPGLPQFVPSAGAPASITSLPPGRQLAALRRAAGRGGTAERLLYGVGLQRVGRPVSAARVFAAAAEAAPASAEAQVADAVGRFDKARPEAAFSRLGPLTRRFPRSASVRFHLGLLLLWSGELEEARKQLRLAGRVEPRSPLALEAARYLARLRASEAG